MFNIACQVSLLYALPPTLECEVGVMWVPLGGQMPSGVFHSNFQERGQSVDTFKEVDSVQEGGIFEEVNCVNQIIWVILDEFFGGFVAIKQVVVKTRL